MADCPEFRGALVEALQTLHVQLDPQTLERLEGFAALVHDANQRMNLTGITDPADVAVKHFADSLSVIKAGIPVGAKLIDVGTGAGFPGVPLAIARPDLEVVLLDSTQKKAGFLSEACEALGLARCRAVAGRGEQLAHDAQYRESFDIAIWRGLGPLTQSAEVCLPYVRIGGRGIAMKGPRLDEELADARALLGQLGGSASRVFEIPLPGGLSHRLLVIRKTKESPAHFPRPWGKIRKR